MPLRLVTETLRNAAGPLAGTEVSFARVDAIPASEGTYPPALVRVTSDGSGIISISLPVSASGGVRYAVGLPNAAAPVPIIITNGPPTTLGALLVAALTTADPNDLQVLLGAHEGVKASSAVLGHIRIGNGLSIDPDGVMSVVGGSGGGLRYEHTQSSAATEWIVNHNFGVYPAVEVRTLGGVKVDCGVIHSSSNQVRITSAVPFTGIALCKG